MASIRKRNSKWQVRINRDDISVTKTFSNKKDGETWARLTEVAIERNEFTLETKRATEKLGELFDQYNKEVAPLHRSKTTSFMLASLKSKLGNVRVDSFNARDLADWRDKRLQEVKAASVVRELNTLSALLNHARKEWCIQIANPVADIKRPTVCASRTRRLIDDEESRIVKELPPMYSNIVRFALATSMRRGEVLTLLWANVNLDMQVAVLPMTKNGETRRVPLSKDAVAILKEQRLATVQSITGRVFDVSQISLDKAWRKACRKAGVLGLRFHDLRHEAISRLFEIGLNPMEVSSISGHKTLQMLKRYTHLKAEDLAKKLG
jgi:integrase